MPFVPDAHYFSPQVHIDGSIRHFQNHAVELLFATDCEAPKLQIERVRRTNSSETVDPRFWRLEQPRLFDKETPSLYLVALNFQGREFSEGLEDRAKSCQQTASLLELFRVGGRLHVEVVVDSKQQTNLFLNLDYRITKHRSGHQAGHAG